MKFQYFSDVHLEHLTKNDIKNLNIIKNAPYLILAGDIGYPRDEIYDYFLSMMSLVFDHVFIIAGNHEYFSTEEDLVDKIDDIIRNKLNKYNNITYLQNEIYKIPKSDIIIFGGTLWTDIKKSEEKMVFNTIGDYKYILNFTPDKPRNMHKHAIKKLEEYIEMYPNNKFIVISHHMPKKMLIDPKYRNAINNSAYASDVKIADNKNIIKWICGHTHTKTEIGKYLINPIGYKNQNENINFNETFEI